MPGSQRDGKYSSATGVIFLFNLIVGVGSLALPGALQRAGWVVGVFLLLTLGFFSFLTVTFVVESLAVANALSKKRGSFSGDNGQRQVEETPLVPRYDGQTVFEITDKFEIGQMGVMMTPKWCQIIIYICLILYLYGDLAIYAVVIGRTCCYVFCSSEYKEHGGEIADEDLCWKNHPLKRIDVFRLSVAVYALLMGPFICFNLQKTKFLQILTATMRWLAFFIMVVWSTQKLIVYGKKGNPPLVDYRKLPALFGALVYSFMCQHSIPGLLQPIRNKTRLRIIIGTDFLLASLFYLLLAVTALFAFEHVLDIYTLNYWYVNADPKESPFLRVLAYYLALFPVFTLTTNFPIIGITLRNNIRSLILRDTPHKWYYDRVLLPLITVLPPICLAIAVPNVHLLIGIVGSYAGAFVQYLIPCLLVTFARSAARDFENGNAYVSPFKQKFWVYCVYAWMIVCLIFITVNYATHL